MLIELWERLRGYDKWVQADATIQSSNLKHMPIYESHSSCGIGWTDAAGKQHSDTYEVSENSPLYQLYDGQTVKIRYSPADPDKFFLRGAVESQLVTFLKWKVGLALIFAAVLLIWGLDIYFRFTSVVFQKFVP